MKLGGLMWHDIEGRFSDRDLETCFIDTFILSTRAVRDRFYWVLSP